jgi:uncharacterized membrane protein YhaH (DUF805 family)
MRILRGLFSFFGRLSRADYALTLLIGVVVPMIAFGILESSPRSDPRDAAQILCMIVWAWVLLAAMAKRFHDIDKTGWATLAVLVPIVGQFTPFVLLFVPGTDGPNQYGRPESVFVPPNNR